MRNICSIYESCIGFIYALANLHIYAAYMRSIYAAYTVFFHGITIYLKKIKIKKNVRDIKKDGKKDGIKIASLIILHRLNIFFFG